jgi:hypothetical protein
MTMGAESFAAVGVTVDSAARSEVADRAIARPNPNDLGRMAPVNWPKEAPLESGRIIEVAIMVKWAIKQIMVEDTIKPV